MNNKAASPNLDHSRQFYKVPWCDKQRASRIRYTLRIRYTNNWRMNSISITLWERIMVAKKFKMYF